MRAHLRCNTCGSQPCVNPGFCAACRVADRLRKQGPIAPAEPVRNFEDIPVSQWSEQEGFLHLQVSFDMACQQHPDAMGPYITMLVETDDIATQQAIMTQGMRDTFSVRYEYLDRFLGT